MRLASEILVHELVHLWILNSCSVRKWILWSLEGCYLYSQSQRLLKQCYRSPPCACVSICLINMKSTPSGLEIVHGPPYYQKPQ
jgi:hypothetical protein